MVWDIWAPVYQWIQCKQNYPCTKLVVPSTGSTIHVGFPVKTQGSPAATDSSPMKLKHTVYSLYFRSNMPYLGITLGVEEGVNVFWPCVSMKDKIPVFRKLLLHWCNNKLLHILVYFSDEVDRRAFAHDLQVILQSTPYYLTIEIKRF